MQVFIYGFITLMTLISVANIFNTVSTGIDLRRKEFAMLKSVTGISMAYATSKVKKDSIIETLKSEIN